MGIETAILAATAASAYSSYQAGEAQEEQFRAEQRKAEIQNVRSVRQQIREARMAQASMTNVAAQTGGMGGSGLAGGTSSVGAQLAGNLSYMSDIATENTAITNAAISATNWQTTATIFGQIGSAASTYNKVKTPTKPAQ
ncbi:hypothetical protein UFOVP337_11 [uncultured Caudovirales phage]|uniref:Uncharacterized protein n=1 Tax=uncultured Caudovirales phage TaxID=2100421 RepID=A0A6J5LYT2_9CAUD|nr:hypothetical protein UFOVP337_11 [uncultured Caudovirales phage]